MYNMRSPGPQYESDTDFTTKKMAALAIDLNINFRSTSNALAKSKYTSLKIATSAFLLIANIKG